MASQDATELVVAGTGDIYVGPVGATLPTTAVAAPSPHFVQLGFTTEDGVTLTRTPEIQDFGAWQSRTPVRRELTSEEVTLAFQLEQWNAENFAFAFGGGEITDLGGGMYRYDFLAPEDQLAENSLIADWRDGSKRYRLCIPRGNVTESTETQLVRGALAVLPVSFKALAPDDASSPAYLLTNDPNFGDPIAS
jgi:hypothetical protein